MGRIGRVVTVGEAHHITHRGIERQPIFHSDQARSTYLHLLGEQAALCKLRLLGYCLMTNHAQRGLEAAMYAEGLKDFAQGGWTLAAWLKGARDARKLANLSGLLREALKGKGNFGIGEGTAQDAEELGKAWVGDGATTASDGKTLVISDKLRTYRPPSYKQNLEKIQAKPRAEAGTWRASLFQ